MYKRRERKNKRDGLTAEDPGLAAASAASAASEPENVPLALRLWQWQWELTSITSIVTWRLSVSVVLLNSYPEFQHL